MNTRNAPVIVDNKYYGRVASYSRVTTSAAWNSKGRARVSERALKTSTKRVDRKKIATNAFDAARMHERCHAWFYTRNYMQEGRGGKKLGVGLRRRGFMPLRRGKWVARWFCSFDKVFKLHILIIVKKIVIQIISEFVIELAIFI